MATINPTPASGAARMIVTWPGMATGDTVNAFSYGGRPPGSITMHAFGTWGGATVALTASLDGTNYDAMPDGTGTAISATDDAIVAVGAAATYFKPTITGGTSDSVTVVLAIWYDE